MPVKIRLQRHGKKANAFFHIVIADGRAPRDGKFIEKIGTYNPTTNPASIVLDTDSALSWLDKGAQPTDTCRSILSFKGVMHKKHLQGGVTKGALTQEQADAKFAKWLSDKETKITGKLSKMDSSKKDAHAKRMKAEVDVKEAKAAKIIAKNTAVAEASAVDEAPAAEATGETPAEA